MTWQDYLRAMGSIFLRDFYVFTRYPFNAVFRLIEPVVWLAPVYFMSLGFSVEGQAVGFATYTGTSDFMAFIILGAIISNYISAVFWGIGFSMKIEMDSGVLESNWLTPQPRVVHLLGRTLFNVLITSINCIWVAFLAYYLFGFSWGDGIGMAVLTLLPMLIALYGLGFILAGIVLLMREANTLIDTSSYLVSMLAGANFPVTVLPRFLLVISFALPITYGFDAVRGIMLGTKTLLPLATEQLILVLFMVVMTVLGAMVFKVIERYCRRMGTIGYH